MKLYIRLLSTISICFILLGCGQGSLTSDSGQQVDIENDEAFTPLDTDIIQTNTSTKNVEVMEQFVADSNAGQEGEVRYVIFENDHSQPTAVYTLKSRVDHDAHQQCVEISRDWSYDLDGKRYIEPQQCSNVSKDLEHGYYVLNKCFHQWEIDLMPISLP